MNKRFPQRRYSLVGCLARLYAGALPDWTVFTVFMVVFLYPPSSQAQIKITFPVNRQIVQRSNSNQATVQIAGSYGQALDAVEARAVARAANQGTDTDWVTLQNNPSNGQFTGTMTVKGGWYKLQVRGRSGGNIVATDELDRFGVGEVFAIIGHSNAQGSGCTVNGEDRCPSLPGASDDRVNVIAIDQNGAAFQQYLSNADSQNTADSKYLPGLNFSQLLSNSGMAPFAKIPWLWGPMGDALVARINVPVLLYNAGFGGTNMEQTYWAAYDIPFQHSFVRYDLRMPYANLRNLMNLYVPTTGIRAVLVQHGENDRGNPTDKTLMYYRGVINKTRTEFNKPDLGFIISLSSFYLSPNYEVRAAEYQAIDPTGFKTFIGPDLDEINSTADRPDGAHFSPSGQTKAGQAWARAITDAYLTTDISPYPAETQPLTTLSCASGNQLVVSQPGGYQPIWNTTSTATSLTVGEGTYSARIMDAQHKVLFPPAVVIPAVVRPETPTVTSNTGTMVICQSTGITLNSSYSGLNAWNTGSNASSIVAITPGVYTVQAKNAVYGCLSNPVSTTISRAAAALTLDLQSSRKVVAVSDTVTFQLTVKNNSGCYVERVTFENRLPPNVLFTSTASSLTLLPGDTYGNTKLVSGLVGQIQPGQSVRTKYIARLMAPGTYVSAAEILTTSNPAQNFKAANGTANGEEDEAHVDLRTSTSSSDVFVSPNPNQGAIKPTQPNQPLPDPNEADLSLAIQANSRVVAVGNTVSFSLTVSNRGILTATNINLIDRLPTGLQFVSSSSGMSANGRFVSVGLSELTAGHSVVVEFVAKVVAQGVFTNQAEISASDQPDLDSKPNNGYSNGEDDQASIDLRTI